MIFFSQHITLLCLRKQFKRETLVPDTKNIEYGGTKQAMNNYMIITTEHFVCHYSSFCLSLVHFVFY